MWEGRSGHEKQMIGTVQVDIFVKIADQIESALCQERQDRIEALLKVLVREHKVMEVGHLFARTLVSSKDFAGRFALHFVDLVDDFGGAFPGCGSECGIE